MADEEGVRDIYEVPRLEPVVELEPVSEPEKDPEEDPEEYPEEDTEEDPEEDQVVLKYVADDATQVEEVVEGDYGIPDQGLGAVQAVMQALIDRNRECVWEVEIDTRIRVENVLEGVEADLRQKKRRMDRMQYIFRTSFWQLRDKIEHYPTELGQIDYTISGTMASNMIYDEYEDAIRGGL